MGTFIITERGELRLIIWAAKALSKDKTRPALNGFGISTIEGEKVMCATDGGRAHWVPCPDALKELPDGSCLSKTALNRTTCVLTLEDRQYPNISQVVPSREAFKVYKKSMGHPQDSFIIAAHHGDTGRLLRTEQVSDLFTDKATLLSFGTPKENEAGPCRFRFSADRQALLMPAKKSR